MHIALLEDDPDQRALLQLWLQASGHDCVGWDNLATFKDGFPRSHFNDVICG